MLHFLLYINYNLWYFGGTISWAGTSYNNLAAFQSGEGQEANGIQSNPLFLSTDPTSEDFLVPAADSPACGAASDGGDIGALDCEVDIVPPAFDNIWTNASITTYYNSAVYINASAFSDNNISAYTVSIKNNSDSTWYNLTITNLDGSTNATIEYEWDITDFTATGGTQYFKLWANTTTGESDESSESSFEVRSILPPTITTIPTLNARTTTTLNWSVVFSEYCNISGVYTGGTFSSDSAEETQTVYISGLTASTQYNFNITSYCNIYGICNDTVYSFSFNTSTPTPTTNTTTINEDSIEALAGFIPWIAIIMVVIVFALVVGIFTQRENMSMQDLKTSIIIIVNIVILLAIGMVVLSVLGG